MLNLLQKLVRWFFMRAENLFNVAFGEKINPFYHLGTISFWQFWLLVGTGIYLYIFAETGVHDAYQSIERITHNQWWAGGIMRSIHRYATDGMILTMLLQRFRWELVPNQRIDRYFGITLAPSPRVLMRVFRTDRKVGRAAPVHGSVRTMLDLGSE